MTKRLMLLAILFGLLALPAFVSASPAESTYYVATDGDDEAAGTIGAPFATMQKAVDTIAALSLPEGGVTVYLRGGSYYEPTVTKSGFGGEDGKRVTFTNYQDEVVTITGAQDIDDIATGDWTQHSGNIYKRTVDPDVSQLWVDGVCMTAARWPNCNIYDGTHWFRERYWGYIDESSVRNNIVDLPHHDIDLAAENTSFDGGMLVMQFSGKTCWATRITDHTAGDPNIYFDREFTGSAAEFAQLAGEDDCRYFIECCLTALDAENEWYYDTGTNTLYLWAPGGGDPSGKTILGKTQSNAFDLQSAKYLTLEGLNFFGTAFRMNTSERITLENCDFEYSSYGERMLGQELTSSADPMPPDLYLKGIGHGTCHRIVNCTFKHIDCRAMYLKNAPGSHFENLLFYDTWNISFGTPIIKQKGDDPLEPRSEWIRMTVEKTGAKTIMTNSFYNYNMMELSRMNNAGWAGNDGAWVESGCAPTRYCWVWDYSNKKTRLDGSDKVYGLFHNIVSWNADSNRDKGDYHEHYNYTGFSGVRVDLVDEAIVGTGNGNSIIRNCAVDEMAGTAGDPNYAVGSGTVSNNFIGDVKAELRDWRNWDFRLKAGSDLIDAGYEVSGITDGYLGDAPDIGAYEYGDPNYWIPGYQYPEASTAIPPDGTVSAKVDADLMWLIGYTGTASQVYFGTSEAAVTAATTVSAEYKGQQTTNIYDPNLTAGETYYWRIDSVTPSGTVKGDTWDFMVYPSSTDTDTFDVIADSYMEKNYPGTNNGSATLLKLRNWNICSGGSQARLKFNVTGLTGTVVEARLKFMPALTGFDIHAREVLDESWTENGLTWFNRPVEKVYPISVTPGWVQADTWYELDVSPIITGNGIFMIALTSRQVIDSDFGIYSKEYDSGSCKPQLIVITKRVPGPPGQATSPDPADEETDVDINDDLSWTAGSGVTSHDVYFGTASPGTSQGNQPGTSFEPGTMDADTMYYWRIDEVNAYGTTTGNVWSFTTAAGGEDTFYASEDSWVSDGSSTNYGSDIEMQTTTSKIGFVKFAVSGTSGTINSAILRLYMFANNNTNTNVYSVTDNSWDEDTIDGTNEPTLVSELDNTTPSATGWIEFDVSSFVIGNGTFSFGFDQDNNDKQKWYTKDYDSGSYTPELIVRYDTATTVPDVTGQSRATAESDIVAVGLVVGTVATEVNGSVPIGDVISQTPTGGVDAVVGSSVDLVVSVVGGSVNLPDFAVLSKYWLSDCSEANSWCEGMDCDHFDGVDIFDLEEFALRWIDGI